LISTALATAALNPQRVVLYFAALMHLTGNATAVIVRDDE
jgi:hypothetical protein